MRIVGANRKVEGGRVMTNRFHAFARWMAAIACTSMLTPRVSWGEEANLPRTAPRPVARVTDVRLDAQQRLRGQFVDRQGRPQNARPVQLYGRDGLIGRAKTGPDGLFCFDSVPGGVYQLRIENQAAVCRAWTMQSAPPTARPAILLVDGAAVRGQQTCFTPAPSPPSYPDQVGPYSGHFDGAIMRTLSSPWVVGGLIAAGIAVPLALADDSEGS